MGYIVTAKKGTSIIKQSFTFRFTVIRAANFALKKGFDSVTITRKKPRG